MLAACHLPAVPSESQKKKFGPISTAFSGERVDGQALFSPPLANSWGGPPLLPVPEGPISDAIGSNLWCWCCPYPPFPGTAVTGRRAGHLRVRLCAYFGHSVRRQAAIRVAAARFSLFWIYSGFILDFILNAIASLYFGLFFEACSLRRAAHHSGFLVCPHTSFSWPSKAWVLDTLRGSSQSAMHASLRRS